MCDEEQKCDQVENDQTETQLSLLDLPIEVCVHKFRTFINILYVDAVYLILGEQTHYSLIHFQFLIS